MVDSYGLIDSKAFWNSMFWTYVFHGQPVGSGKIIFFYISTITADIWTKFGLHIGITQLY